MTSHLEAPGNTGVELCGAINNPESSNDSHLCALPPGHDGPYHRAWSEEQQRYWLSWPVVDVIADAAFARAVNRIKARGDRLRDVTEYGWFIEGVTEAVEAAVRAQVDEDVQRLVEAARQIQTDDSDHGDTWCWSCLVLNRDWPTPGCAFCELRAALEPFKAVSPTADVEEVDRGS